MTQKLERDLIFYNPRKPGAIFRYAVGHDVNFEVVYKTVSQLEHKTESSVSCVLERRKTHRIEDMGRCSAS